MYVYIFILVSLLCFKHTAAHTYFVDQEVFFFLCVHIIYPISYIHSQICIFIYIYLFMKHI